MANADQILSLIRNHLNNDDAQFRKVALQISAVEAKNGHAVLARTIQELLSQRKTSFSALKLIPRNKDVDDLLLQVETYDCLKNMVTDKTLKEKIQREKNLGNMDLPIAANYCSMAYLGQARL